jgi:hypothetical protein
MQFVHISAIQEFHTNLSRSVKQNIWHLLLPHLSSLNEYAFVVYIVVNSLRFYLISGRSDMPEDWIKVHSLVAL